jgi:hypothetical protein
MAVVGGAVDARTGACCGCWSQSRGEKNGAAGAGSGTPRREEVEERAAEGPGATLRGAVEGGGLADGRTQLWWARVACGRHCSVQDRGSEGR